jgi:hypothetical protein
MNHQVENISIVICIGLITAFMLWYQWGGAELSATEVSNYMHKIEAQMQTSSAKHDLDALRKFLSEDDGQPFYTVNLY